MKNTTTLYHLQLLTFCLILSLFLACQNQTQSQSQPKAIEKPVENKIVNQNKPSESDKKDKKQQAGIRVKEAVDFEDGFKAVVLELAHQQTNPTYEVIVQYLQFINTNKQTAALTKWNLEQKNKAQELFEKRKADFDKTAKADKVEGEDTYSLIATPMLFNDTLISFFTTKYEWIATQKRSAFVESFNYTYPSIKPFSLQQYFPKQKDYLNQISKKALIAYKAEYDDAESTDLDGFAPKAENFNIYYFSEDGLHLYFPAYLLGIGEASGEEGREVVIGK